MSFKQRGRYHPKMKVDDMREELAKHHDFRDEKKTSRSVSFMNMAMLAYSSPSFIVKSTPLNAVGLRLNATLGHCSYNIIGLRHNVGPGLDSVSTTNLYTKLF